MTPQQKATELFNNFNNLGKDFTRGVSMKEFAKECSLIVVKEIILSRREDTRFDDKPYTHSKYYTPNPLHSTYWELVEEELKKI